MRGNDNMLLSPEAFGVAFQLASAKRVMFELW